MAARRLLVHVTIADDAEIDDVEEVVVVVVVVKALAVGCEEGSERGGSFGTVVADDLSPWSVISPVISSLTLPTTTLSPASAVTVAVAPASGEEVAKEEGGDDG